MRLACGQFVAACIEEHTLHNQDNLEKVTCACNMHMQHAHATCNMHSQDNQDHLEKVP